MGEALKVLVGPQAQGLSASTVSRLKQVWGEQYRLGCEERLDADRWVYVWADGIYSGLRAEQTKLCADYRCSELLRKYGVSPSGSVQAFRALFRSIGSAKLLIFIIRGEPHS